jgi:hypothetical protein
MYILTMNTSSLTQNSIFIFRALSFYAPIIISVSIVVFSMFTATMEKAFVYFVWMFLITFIRIIVFKGLGATNMMQNLKPGCNFGVTNIFYPNDITYSIYILTFSMMYFMTPMFIMSSQHNINAINFGILSFYVSYITLDLFVKSECISIMTSSVFANIVSGILLGSTISGLIMYGSEMKKYLFMNEVNNNQEVCSKPSNQQFKCRLFKNGELVGNI